jgi:hypothetical protein
MWPLRSLSDSERGELNELLAEARATAEQIWWVALGVLGVAIIACPPWIIFSLEPFHNPHSTEIMIVGFLIYGALLVPITLTRVLERVHRPSDTSQSAREIRWLIVSRVVEAYLVLIGSFAAVYFQLAHTHPTQFQVAISHHVQVIYFTIGTFTTTGFGDIHPQKNLSQILVSAQMVVALIMIGVVVAALTVRLIESFRTDDSPADGTPPKLRRCDPQA